MNKKNTNGQTNKARSQKGKNQFDDNSKISSKNEGNSGGTKYESRRTTGNVGTSLGRITIYRSFGGILGLLREIVNKGLGYMDTHSERLEARLTESRRAKAEFLEQAAALEKEIVRLLEQAENVPENLDTEEE